jgi:hypothetical protein
MNVPPSTYLASVKKPLKGLVETLGKDFPYVSVLSTDSTGMLYSVRKRAISARQSNWCERGFAPSTAAVTWSTPSTSLIRIH